MNEVIATISLLAIVALVGGGISLVKKPADRFRGILMFVAALVLLGNILVQTIPF